MAIVAQTLFSSLSIEITRRCNQKCEHCMRGDAQNVVFDPEIFDNFCERHNLRYFKILWINGGEPTLVPDVIRKVLDIVRRRNIWVERFGIGTNGTHMDVLNDLAGTIRSMPDHIGRADLCISNDAFHKKPWSWCEGMASMIGDVNFVVRDTNVLIPVGRSEGRTDVTHDAIIEEMPLGSVLYHAMRCQQFFSLACDGRVLCGLDLPYGVDDSYAFMLPGESLRDIPLNKTFSVLHLRPRIPA